MSPQRVAGLRPYSFDDPAQSYGCHGFVLILPIARSVRVTIAATTHNASSKNENPRISNPRENASAMIETAITATMKRRVLVTERLIALRKCASIAGSTFLCTRTIPHMLIESTPSINATMPAASTDQDTITDESDSEMTRKTSITIRTPTETTKRVLHFFRTEIREMPDSEIASAARNVIGASLPAINRNVAIVEAAGKSSEQDIITMTLALSPSARKAKVSPP